MTLNKIKALYANELIKIIHRPSVIIVATVTFLLSIMFPFLLRIVYGDALDTTITPYTKEEVETDLNSRKVELRSANMKTTKETVEIEVNGQTKSYEMVMYTGNDIPSLMSNINCLEDVLGNYDFEKYPLRSTWLAINAYQMYRSSEEKLIYLQTTAFEERDSEWLKEYENKTTANGYFRKALMEHDYETYCKGLEIFGARSSYYDERETPEIVRQLAASDPKGELGWIDASYLMAYLREKQSDKETLDSGLEASGSSPRILSEERRVILQNDIKILDYKFEKRSTYNEASSIALEVNYITGQVSQYCLLILIILIAGSAISQELATGSIKSLIIAPVRRWKIYTAKLLSIITWMILASVLVSLLSVIGTGFAFGFNNLPPYLFVSGGSVTEMSYPFAKILFDLVNNISPFFYAFVAFMLSCYTKNTGVSVGVAVGMLLCHQIPTILAESEMPPRILDFTPVANMELSGKFFPYIAQMVVDSEFSLFGASPFSLPLWFSITYIIVLTFTVLFIAFEEFTKKDIS